LNSLFEQLKCKMKSTCNVKMTFVNLDFKILRIQEKHETSLIGTILLLFLLLTEKVQNKTILKCARKLKKKLATKQNNNSHKNLPIK
jgi:hypothetical protein